MANSLQDQLLKAGLAKDKPKGKKKKSPKAKKQNRAAGTANEASKGPSQVEINKIAKAERDRELNAKREAELARRQLVGQIRQIIESTRVDISKGDVDYNFTDGKTVRKLLVSAPLHAQLIAGTAAVARLDGAHHVVPEASAQKIGALDKSFLVVFNSDEGESLAEDDDYAEYQVPDDLMW